MTSACCPPKRPGLSRCRSRSFGGLVAKRAFLPHGPRAYAGMGLGDGGYIPLMRGYVLRHELILVDVIGHLDIPYGSHGFTTVHR